MRKIRSMTRRQFGWTTVGTLLTLMTLPERSDADHVSENPIHTSLFPSADSDAKPAIGPANGTLVIVGGGNIGPNIWERLLAPARGKQARVVVIPTAQEDAGLPKDKTVQEFHEQGLASVTLLHTRDPKEADTEAFVAPLKTATLVWFTGGRQWRIADAYLHTRTHTELNAVLNRGGVIGGTSAGATIQGEFLARGDTKGNEVLIGDHTEGLGLLKKVTIDQHLLQRNRQFDLISVIEKHPDLLGIGIDESTAIIVQGDQFKVVGQSYVAIYDANEWKATKPPGATVEATRKGRFYLLHSGQHFDLKARKVVERQGAQ